MSHNIFSRLLLVFFISLFFGFFFGTNSVSAVSITNVLANQTRYNKNASETDSYYNTSGTLPLTIYTGTGHTGFWDFSNNVVFANPGGATSTNSYVAEATVTFTANAPIVNGNITKYASLTSIRPEGVSLGSLQPGSSTTVDITALSSYSITFKIRQVGLLASNVNVTNWLIGINYSPETIFWCSSDSSQTCSSNITLTLNSLDFNVTFETSQTDSLLQTQVNQNQTIINQNQQIIQGQDEYHDKEYESVDNIENQSPDDYSDTENQATTNIIGVISSFFGQFSNFSATTCDVSLPFPEFLGGSMTQNICQGKDEAGQIISIVGSLIMIGFYIPLAFALLKMIYSEIRSFTNG